MNLTLFSWMRSLLLLASLVCGSLELSSRGDEPNSPAPVPANPPAWPVNRGGRVERLLEDLSPPRLMMWDDRVLCELRLRLAATADAARRHQQENQTRPNPGRSGYGDVAPLAFVPRRAEPSQHGGLGVYRDEIGRLDALIAQHRASAADFFLHGLIHYESGDFRTALRDFDQAILLNRSPNDVFYSLRGLAHFGLGEYRAAASDLDEAVRRSSNVRNLNNRGVVASLLGQTDRALQDFEAALTLRQWTVKPSPVCINRALTQCDLGRHEQAVADLKRVIETSGDPDAVGPASSALGFVYRRMGDFGRSGFAYDSVVRRKRADLIASGQSTQTNIDAMPENQSFLDDLAGEETAVDALIGRGIAHHELNQVVPAIDDYSKAIRLCPKRTATYVNRAVAYVDRGDLDLAEHDLEAALRLDAADPFALGNRGLLRIRQGQAALGQADLARCVELRKDLQPIIARILGRGQQPQTSEPRVKHLRPSPFSAEPTPVGKP